MLFLKVLRRRMTIFVGISTAKSTGGMLQQTSSSWKSRGEYWEKEKEKEPSTPTQRQGSPIGWRVAKRHLQEKYKEFQHLHNYTLNLHNCPLSPHNSLLNLQIYLMNLLTKNWWMKAHWRRKKYRTLHSFKVKLEMLSTEKTLRKQDIIDALLCLPQRPEWQPETEVPRSKTALLGANHYS